MGVGCGCCSPPDPPDAAADDASEIPPPSLFYQPYLEELTGIGYCDSHCHLDTLLQNHRHGGLGWDCKQKLCKYWLEGDCPFEDCDYAHGDAQILPRIPLEHKDIEPYLLEFFPKRDGIVVDTTKKATEGDASSPGPILQCIITNVCEVAAIEDTRRILQIADSVCPGSVFVSFGCHPHDYRDYSDAMEAQLIEELIASGSHAIAWGECGLDYCKNYEESLRPPERKRMMDIFARQARIAVERKLPLVVHSRDAESDTLEVLKENLPRDHKFHIHAYQGELGMMREALELFPNCIFGVSTMIMLAYPSVGAVKVAVDCPLERLILETDAPYLSQGSHDVPKLAKQVAVLKGMSAVKVMEVTSGVCQRFYGVPLVPLLTNTTVP